MYTPRLTFETLRACGFGGLAVVSLERKAGSIFILVDIVVAVDRRRNFPKYHDCARYVRGFDELPTVNHSSTRSSKPWLLQELPWLLEQRERLVLACETTAVNFSWKRCHLFVQALSVCASSSCSQSSVRFVSRAESLLAMSFDFKKRFKLSRK